MLESSPAAGSAESPWYALRSMEPGDLPFVMNSWLRSYAAWHHTANVARKAHGFIQRRKTLSRALSRGYGQEHSRVLAELLDMGVVVVACLAEEPDMIAGWAIGQDAHDVTAVHYVYVKSAYRRQGIGRALTRQLLDRLATRDDVVHTHHTPIGRTVLEHTLGLRDAWPHVPYTAFLAKEKETHEDRATDLP